MPDVDSDVAYEELPELGGALAEIMAPVEGVDLTMPTGEQWAAEDD